MTMTRFPLAAPDPDDEIIAASDLATQYDLDPEQIAWLQAATHPGPWYRGEIEPWIGMLPPEDQARC